jgi:hypothetical protein
MHAPSGIFRDAPSCEAERLHKHTHSHSHPTEKREREREIERFIIATQFGLYLNVEFVETQLREFALAPSSSSFRLFRTASFSARNLEPLTKCIFLIDFFSHTYVSSSM